jgi:hypothetical protein
MFEVTATQHLTRQLLSSYMEKLDNADNAAYCGGLMVAKVFIALHANSIPAYRVNTLAAALYNCPTPDLQKTLTAMVKAKVLRSRVKSGERLYEVNY